VFISAPCINLQHFKAVSKHLKLKLLTIKYADVLSQNMEKKSGVDSENSVSEGVTF